jgi:hypothetical protein
VRGVRTVLADIVKGEVEVEAAPGKVKAQDLIDAVNRAEDSQHEFRAKLISQSTRD